MKRIINILLVGNEPKDEATLRESLDRRGILYHLIFTADAGDVLDVMKSLKVVPDIILLDIVYAGVRGFELATKLRANTSYDDAKLFMVSSTNDENDRKTSATIGASGLIVRPLNLERLVINGNMNLVIDLMNS